MGLKDLKHRKTEQGNWKCTWGWGSKGATVERDKLSLRISTGSNKYIEITALQIKLRLRK